MIVDLERNDLGRICRPGSVEVPELAVLHSFPAVHHLVARVRGRIRDGVSWTEMVRAIFPGGSITGAPKKSAIERLRRVEPVARGPFTGSLFWCGDDGSVDSSILIRTAVFAGERVSIGAGGGIVADSEPEAEWAESNHKARALTRALGFDPEGIT
jgi:anthranilate synthase component 1